MSDQTDKIIEKPEASKPETTEPLSSKGIDSVRGEEQVIKDDYSNYLEKLYKYRAEMQEKGNMQAVEETNDEIEKIDVLLVKTVQRKHGINPDSG